MAAATKNRNTPQRETRRRAYPIGASVIAFAGAIAVLNASGYVVPATTATGLKCVGRFAEYCDNSSGANGAQMVEVESGCFRYDNSASADEITVADVGEVCYLVDDQTVALTSATSTRSRAGVIDQVDDAGVWVIMGPDVVGFTS